jgi:hypothetical protein
MTALCQQDFSDENYYNKNLLSLSFLTLNRRRSLTFFLNLRYQLQLKQSFAKKWIKNFTSIY